MFPENIAFPLGGEGTPQYVVMELHYDNPHMVQGMKNCLKCNLACVMIN